MMAMESTERSSLRPEVVVVDRFFDLQERMGMRSGSLALFAVVVIGAD
jgi:hypothetical protein